VDMSREMPGVFRTLERWILDNGSGADVRHFEVRWGEVRPGKDALPCPQCFLNGDDQPLAPMDIEESPLGSVRPWICSHCKERYDVLLQQA